MSQTGGNSAKYGKYCLARLLFSFFFGQHFVFFLKLFKIVYSMFFLLFNGIFSSMFLTL